MDVCLVTDPLSKASIAERLRAMPREVTWDELKLCSREILVRAGRECKTRISSELDDILRKLCIIES